jgi:hypothetical protein
MQSMEKIPEARGAIATCTSERKYGNEKQTKRQRSKGQCKRKVSGFGFQDCDVRVRCQRSEVPPSPRASIYAKATARQADAKRPASDFPK